MPPGNSVVDRQLVTTNKRERVPRIATPGTRAIGSRMPIAAATVLYLALSTRLGAQRVELSGPANRYLQTTMYTPFPSPFDGASRPACLSFQLAESSTVHLTIFDATQRTIRTIELPTLAPGIYGPARLSDSSRASDTFDSCDRRLAWDGTDDNGKPAPRGRYYVKFEAGKTVETRIVLFSASAGK